MSRGDPNRGRPDRRGRRRLSRRAVVGACAAGISAAVAGCGYQPAGGELDWQETSSEGGGLASSTDELWRSDGAHLFRIRNRSGHHVVPGEGFKDVDDARVTAYDSSGSPVWSGGTEAQYGGDPVVANGRVVLSLENETVVALGRSASDDVSDRRNDTDDAETDWRTNWSGPALELSASDEVVAGVHEGGAVALDGDGGEVRFTVSPETLSVEGIDAAAVGDGVVWIAGGDDSALLGYDSEGNPVADRSLPSTTRWLETAGSVALVGIETADGEDELWGIDDSGDRRLRLPIDRATTPPVVVGDRAYHAAGGTIRAVDVSSGERRWALGDYSIRGDLVVDDGGIYARGSTPGMDGCGLFALDHDGEISWTASVPPEPGCSGELFALEDRLVVVDGGDLYGFRKTSGRRFTLL